jgi:acyl carrier protein
LIVENKEILKTLNDIFNDIFDDDLLILTSNTTAEDIEEWDSLNQIKLIIECERAFNIRLKSRDINILDNIGEMVEHLSKVIG